MALALHRLEQDEEAARCPVCGGPKAECQASENQRAFEADFARCYRTRAVSHAMRAREDDPDLKALVALTRFHPERVKR